jgi:hypothetical protein
MWLGVDQRRWFLTPATVEDIEYNTGLSWDQVVDELMTFIIRGYVTGYIEKYAE